MLGYWTSVCSAIYARLNLKKYIQGQLSANLSVPPPPLSALTSVCLSPASPTEGGLSVHPRLPSLLPQAFAHLSVCSATTVLRVYSVSPSSLLPPSIPLSHVPWSIWTRRERGDLSVKAGGGKWRLRWRRHALYIKCSDPCEGWRWGGGVSRRGYINRLLLKER